MPMQLEMSNMISFNGNEIRIVLLANGDFEVKVVYKNGDRRVATHNTVMGLFMYIEEMTGKRTTGELRKQMLDAVTDTQSVIELRNQLLQLEKIEVILNLQRQIETYEAVDDARE